MDVENKETTKKGVKILKFKLWIGLVLIIGSGIFLIKVNKPIIANQPTLTINQNSANTEIPSSKVSSSDLPKYEQALIKYKDSRIQFNNICQVVPRNSVYKTGTVVMLDNRSASVREVVFEGVKYKIEPYDFRVAKLGSPKTFFVDCDNSQNVATINVQK